MNKQDLIDIVEALPDDAPFDLIAIELGKAHVVAEIEAALKEVAQGDVFSHEVVMGRAKKW